MMRSSRNAGVLEMDGERVGEVEEITHSASRTMPAEKMLKARK